MPRNAAKRRDLLSILVSFAPDEEAKQTVLEVMALHRAISKLEGRTVKNEAVDAMLAAFRQAISEWRLLRTLLAEGERR